MLQPNPTQVKRREVYDVWCDDCGHKLSESYSSRDRANDEAIAHASQHLVWKSVGPSLRGKVFDIDAPGVPWFGIFDTAADAAREADYKFLTWNGWVYEADQSMRHRVCRTVDVPGLS